MNNEEPDFFNSFNIEGNINKINPLLKWAGGKNKILDIILGEYLNTEGGTLYEPFFGSGIVGLNSRFNKVVAGDFNKKLVLFHNGIKHNYKTVLSLIHKTRSELSTDNKTDKYKQYNALRKRFNECEEEYETAALFWVINKICFNGFYREGPEGFNVSFGNRDCPCPDENDFRKASERMQSVDVSFSDFEGTCSGAKIGDIVYLDPPYCPVSKTANFCTYTKDGFGEAEHIRLKELMLKLSSQGIKVVMSNSDSQTTRDIYGELENQGFHIDNVFVMRTIASKVSSRTKAKEVIVSNFKKPL